MAVSKVRINGSTIVDMTDATAEAGHIISPYTAYGADGRKKIGNRIKVNGEIYQDNEGYIVLPNNDVSVDEDKDVVFIDYDGTVIASYSETEFGQLTALPANPFHEGLTAQGWNWTLEDAKSYVISNHYLVIGQLYVPTDGKTHIYVTVGQDEHIRPLTVSFLLKRQSSISSRDVIFSWGDDVSGTYSLPSNNTAVTCSHSYDTPGNYDISIQLSEGLTAAIQSVDNDSISDIRVGIGMVRIGVNTDAGFNRCHYLETVTLHNAFTTFGTYSFSNCNRLKAIVLPGTLTDIANYSFEACVSLKYISVTKNLTRVGSGGIGGSRLVAFSYPEGFTSTQSFSGYRHLRRLGLPTTITSFNSVAYCVSMEKIYFHEGLINITGDAFRGVQSLYSVTLPSTLASIANNTFYGLPGSKAVMELHLKSTTPPTLNAANAIDAMTGNRRIYVPYSADHSVLQAYLDDTNWSTRASYIQEEPQS